MYKKEEDSEENVSDEDFIASDGDTPLTSAVNELDGCWPNPRKRQRQSSSRKSNREYMPEFGYSTFPGFKL